MHSVQLPRSYNAQSCLELPWRRVSVLGCQRAVRPRRWTQCSLPACTSPMIPWGLAVQLCTDSGLGRCAGALHAQVHAMCVPVQLVGPLYQPWRRSLRSVQPLRLTGSCSCSGRMCRIDMPSRKLVASTKRPYDAAFEHSSPSNIYTNALRLSHAAMDTTNTETVSLTSSLDV